MQNNSYRLLDRNEAAEYLGMSTTALDRLTRKGYISYIDTPSSGKVGRPTRKWTIGDLNEFIDSRRRRAMTAQQPTPTATRRRKHNGLDLEHSSAADILAMGDADMIGGAQ